jgi:N-acetylglucosaminyldiphosphoundecaprenol N-acetyl-beta-D-mannosaminyltransferase
MPIVWIARLIGVPIKKRVSGSDVFEALKTSERSARRLSVFLFGGEQGVAAAAAGALNGMPAGLRCAGSLDPGYGTVPEMSRDDIIATINSSDADFLAVSLGAKKGQLWLRRNHARLTIPIRAHLGATINFQAGMVKRAPLSIRACGLEWLWRIKEEPYLWRRYWHDGCVLLRLLLTRVLPLAIANRWHRLRCERWPQGLLIKTAENPDSIMISLCGDAIERHVAKAIAVLRKASAGTEKVIIDLSATRAIDSRFFGLLLMLRKQLKARGATLMFVEAPPAIERMFRLNDVGFLLAAGKRM